MDIKRQAFENLWLAGGGSLDNFIFLGDQGKYIAIENSDLTDKQKEMSLYIVNNAYLFFVGGFKQAAKAQVSEGFVLVEKDKLMQIIGSAAIIEPITRGNPLMSKYKTELDFILSTVRAMIEAQEQSHD